MLSSASVASGEVVLTMPYVEMGQGTYTSIPMLIAEELEIGLDAGAARTCAAEREALRQSAARCAGDRKFERDARCLEADARSRRDSTDDADRRCGKALGCRCQPHAAPQDGEVLHAQSGRRLNYGELAGPKRQMPVPIKTLR